MVQIERELAMVLERYLDKIESSLMHMQQTRAVKYSGHIDESRVVEAFRLLCSLHPILRARVLYDEDGYMLSVVGEDCPEVVVFDGDENTLWREEEKSWGEGGEVAQLVLVRGRTGGIVALRVNHAIVDGVGLFAFFSELWQMYADIYCGRDVSARFGTSLPRAPLELYRQHWPNVGANSSDPLMSSYEPAELCDSVGRRVQLTEDDTARIAVSARDHHTTVGAVVGGSIVLSVRANDWLSDPIKTVTAVNLRNRVDPPVGATEVSNFACIVSSTIIGGEDPFLVGRNWSEQVANSIRCFNVVVPGLSTYDHHELLRSARCTINNGGYVAPLSHPDGVEIIDYLDPPRRRVSLNDVYHIFYTFEGRLNIACHYPSKRFTLGDADQMVDGIIAQLASCCNLDADYRNVY